MNESITIYMIFFMMNPMNQLKNKMLLYPFQQNESKDTLNLIKALLSNVDNS